LNYSKTSGTDSHPALTDFNTITNVGPTYDKNSLLIGGNISGLGPHNTLGTTMTTISNTTNTSNISPMNKNKRLIPDSLVKMPKFSLNL